MTPPAKLYRPAHGGFPSVAPSSGSCPALLDAALDLIAGWCDAVKNGGTGWDDWDEHYKDACYRPGPLRELLDARIETLEALE